MRTAFGIFVVFTLTFASDIHAQVSSGLVGGDCVFGGMVGTRGENGQCTNANTQTAPTEWSMKSHDVLKILGIPQLKYLACPRSMIVCNPFFYGVLSDGSAACVSVSPGSDLPKSCEQKSCRTNEGGLDTKCLQVIAKLCLSIDAEKIPIQSYRHCQWARSQAKEISGENSEELQNDFRKLQEKLNSIQLPTNTHKETTPDTQTKSALQ